MSQQNSHYANVVTSHRLKMTGRKTNAWPEESIREHHRHSIPIGDHHLEVQYWVFSLQNPPSQQGLISFSGRSSVSYRAEPIRMTTSLWLKKKNRLFCNNYIQPLLLKSTTVQSMWRLSNARPIRANQIAAEGRESVSSIVGNDCLI